MSSSKKLGYWQIVSNLVAVASIGKDAGLKDEGILTLMEFSFRGLQNMQTNEFNSDGELVQNHELILFIHNFWKQGFQAETILVLVLETLLAVHEFSTVPMVYKYSTSKKFFGVKTRSKTQQYFVGDVSKSGEYVLLSINPQEDTFYFGDKTGNIVICSDVKFNKTISLGKPREVVSIDIEIVLERFEKLWGNFEAKAEQYYEEQKRKEAKNKIRAARMFDARI